MGLIKEMNMIGENTFHFNWNFILNIYKIEWKRKLWFVSIYIIAFPLLSYSQAKKEPIFPVGDIYFKNWGWKAGIGGNYTIPFSETKSINFNENSDTTDIYNFNPIGKMGMMVEGGFFYLLENPIVSYLDADVRVNWFNGRENFAGIRMDTVSQDTISTQGGYRSFSNFNVSIRLQANNTIHVSKYGFIQNTLGLNFDYLFYENQKIDPPIFPIENTANRFQFQLHYKLSYGLRLDLMHYMIVGVDIPLLTLYPWNDGGQMINMFESRYWPVTVSIQVMFLQKTNRPDCNKPPPLDINKKRKKAKMF
jgi:hypothetical protein